MKNKQVKRMMCDVFFSHWVYILDRGKLHLMISATPRSKSKGVYMLGVDSVVSIKANEVK